MDLKIEIRKLYALHEATIRFDHAIREVGQTAWTDFTPSRFIYAFFTFNSIYAFDWETSFSQQKAVKWIPDANNRVPREDEQFKAYLRHADILLSPNTASTFRQDLAPRLKSFGITNPVDELKAVDVVNATKGLKNLAQQLPGQFARLLEGNTKPNEFFAIGCIVIRFIYEVRCNLFHGSKTRVQLLDPAQQQRLLIYTATLITANSLLFEVAKVADIGWQPVTADFNRHGERALC